MTDLDTFGVDGLESLLIEAEGAHKAFESEQSRVWLATNGASLTPIQWPEFYARYIFERFDSPLSCPLLTQGDFFYPSEDDYSALARWNRVKAAEVSDNE